MRRKAAGVALLTLAIMACATDPDGPPGAGRSPGPGGPGRRATAHGPKGPQALWKEYDLNGDGRITRAEFMAVRGLCFARSDGNGDGVLTSGEIHKRAPSQPPERLSGAIAQLDLNRDGVISREEFDLDSDRLFRQLDTNGDGVLAGNELTNVTPEVLGPLCGETAARPPIGFGH
jgi:hypothetical protein